MCVRSEGDFQFRSDAIGGGHQHRLTHFRKRAIEHAAEASNLRERAGIESSPRQFLDFFGGGIGGVDVHAGVRIRLGDSDRKELTTKTRIRETLAQTRNTCSHSLFSLVSLYEV